MKKIIALLFVISLAVSVFAACNNAEQTSALTESTSTTQSSVTSATSNTTTIATQTTPAITTIPLLYTEYTIGTLEEPAEIQAKIDRNNFNSVAVPSKVIITCKDERDVPYLVLGMGQYYDRFDMEWRGKVIFDGWVCIGGTGTIAHQAIILHGDELPVFHCSSMDELVVYVNDKKVDINKYNFIDENGNKVEYKGNGRYYVYCDVGCVGPDVMRNGEKYDSQSAHYAAVFIVEITE